MITPNSLIFRYFRHVFLALMLLWFSHLSIRAEEEAPYTPHFNPATGFKPAQRSLTQVFLQMAGSFEHFGTPEPYLRHVMAEHTRIDAKYKLSIGKEVSRRPQYITDAYLENLVATWKKLEPVLKLEGFCRESGRNMRYAILGSWNKSVTELAADEIRLSDDEKQTYKSFLIKDYFAKADLPALDAFYKASYDKLTDAGKDQLSKRTWRGTQKAEQREELIAASKNGTIIISIFNEQQKKTLAYIESKTTEQINSDDLQTAFVEKLSLNAQGANWQKLPAEEADALRFSHAIEDAYMMRVDHLHKQPIPQEQADKIEKALRLLINNLLVVAQSEFEAGLNEEFIGKKRNN